MAARLGAGVVAVNLDKLLTPLLQLVLEHSTEHTEAIVLQVLGQMKRLAECSKVNVFYGDHIKAIGNSRTLVMEPVPTLICNLALQKRNSPFLLYPVIRAFDHVPQRHGRPTVRYKEQDCLLL